MIDDALFQQTIGVLGNRAITVGHAASALAVVVALIMIALIIMVVRARSHARQLASQSQLQTASLTQTIEALHKHQAELSGRMQSMSDQIGQHQSNLSRTVNERMDRMGHQMHQSMAQSTHNTQETLTRLQERLSVIDSAQKNITQLSKGVVELQSILANKQTRGAFGQGRMEAIIKDQLPASSYSFQHTLSNGKRPDCVVFLPGEAADLVIDAKFPLEAWQAFHSAANDDLANAATTRFRQDMAKHIKDIRERYFIPGETQDTAFLFVPSEAIFADLHEHFEMIVQQAARQRIVIVSPSLLMLSVQVVQAVLRDARLQEQAHLIQREVMLLGKDLSRLGDRVSNLRRHFAQAEKDITQIETTSGKIIKRGERIQDFGLEDGGESPDGSPVRLVGE